MAYSTGVSLLSVNPPLTLLDDLDDWWDFTSGSFVSGKGLSVINTQSVASTSTGVVGDGVALTKSAVGGQYSYIDLHRILASTKTLSIPIWWKGGIGGDKFRLVLATYGTPYPPSSSAIFINPLSNTIADNNSNSYSTGTSFNLTAGVNSYKFCVIEILYGTYPALVLNVYNGSGTLVGTTSCSNIQQNISGSTTSLSVQSTSSAVSGNNFFIDSLGTYRRSLSSAEIVKLYNSGAGVTYSQLATL